eukprot:TRINITY_DN3286_c0_g1_i2.p1 TRINITY_DN3286_c0_g1~~TRINITY_DN3286_c0_g1_i2.p1  ORF type:complete len:588 (+),score=92.12 TRINITY_DN3286_c0_g1_i2:68-1831(+)
MAIDEEQTASLIVEETAAAASVVEAVLARTNAKGKKLAASALLVIAVVLLVCFWISCPTSSASNSAVDASFLASEKDEVSPLAEVFVFESSTAGWWQPRSGLGVDALSPIDGVPAITVDTDWLDQTVVGFGGALTESSATVFKGLNEQLQNEVIDALYSKDGLNYNMGRTHINSCDFSLSSYSFDDVDGDVHLTHFDTDLQRDQQSLIPFIKRAQAKVKSEGGELKILASPWSPPWWMKQNKNMNKSSTTCLVPEYRKVWAQYIAKWMTSYKQQGISMWGMTIQNEPVASNPWESCRFSGSEEAEFLADHLGPVMKQHHPGVKIFGFDHNKLDMPAYLVNMTKNEKAMKYLDGVTFHWYTGDMFWALMDVHGQHPDWIMLSSEATYERYRMGLAHYGGQVMTPQPLADNGKYELGLGYAHDILGDLNAGASGWIDWNVLLNHWGGPNHLLNTCDATLITDGGGDGGTAPPDYQPRKVWKKPQYYFIGHFSKFIKPGFRVAHTTVEGSGKGKIPGDRVYGTCNDLDGLEAMAAVAPTGETVVVVLRCGAKPWKDLEFKLRIGKEGKWLKLQIPPMGIQTYAFPKHFSA